VNLQYKPTDDLRLTATSLYTKADRGSPGASTIDYRGASDFSARLFDELYLVGLTIDHSPSPEFAYTIKTGYHSAFETYTNPAKNIADRYTNREFLLSYDGVSHSSEYIDYLTAVSLDHSSITSNEHVSAALGGDIHRDTYRGDVGMRVMTGIFQTTGMLKVEKNSDQIDPEILPQISAKFDIPALAITIGASYARLYHEPTFNELYWKNGGLPDLKPERGDAFELVADAAPNNHISVKAAAFYNALQDQIIWQVDSDGVWRPSELQASRTYGVEFTSGLSENISESFDLGIRLALTYQHTENRTPDPLYFGKELPYATPLRWNIAIMPRLRNVGDLTLYYNYRWHRYPTYAANVSDKLPAVGTANVTFRTVPLAIINDLKLVPSFSITNLFDTQYDEISNYPMPGREYKLGVEFTY
jgi:outer membrane cobalamin receptor